MKTPYVMLLACAATMSLAQAGGDKSYLGIFAETHQTIIAGMKMREMPELPAGVKIPASIKAMMGGKPQRALTVRLWSPNTAPQDATATLAPPSGLQVGPKLNLEIYRPQAAPTGAGGGGGAEGAPQKQDFTIKFYWGSSDTVQPGQPKVFNLGTMTPEQQMEMGRRMHAMNPMGGMSRGGGGGSYFYKDGWSTAYWPRKDDTGDIPEGAALPGTYSLNSSYAGNTTIDAPSDVDFLAAFHITSPDLSEKPPLDAALAFQWDPIPNALGQFATAFGLEGRNTLIIWSSSDTWADQLLGDMGYMQMSEVKDAVGNHIFMPGDSTHVTIPAGIFKDSDFAMVNMVAYGPGTARGDGNPVPRIQTKSSTSIMLGKREG